jgi:probable lipoprotein NlpC
MLAWLKFARKVIGRPFREPDWDCWGLVVSAYRECLGVALPPLEVLPEQGMAGQRSFRDAEMANWHLVEKEQVGDVALFRPLHVGLIIAPGKMLHTAQGINTCIESYRGLAWRHRLQGIYRYAGPGAP